MNCDDGDDDNDGDNSLEEIIVASSSPGLLQGRSESPVTISIMIIDEVDHGHHNEVGVMENDVLAGV